jgi:hypothetical protein
MKRIIVILIILSVYAAITSALPGQRISAPADKMPDVIAILNETGYYNDPQINSITFTSTAEVSRICEMLPGRTAIGCTQPHWLYSNTFDIWISNEDQDWRNTLLHEIGHVGFGNESEADTFMMKHANDRNLYIP